MKVFWSRVTACGCVCDDFTEAASLAGLAGGVPVGTV